MSGELNAMAMAEEPKPLPARKSRFIVRLATFLASHSAIVSVFSCVAGFIALLLLPVLATNTYVSENALIPGSANPIFSDQDVLEANRFANDIYEKRMIEDAELTKFILKRMEDVGAEAYYHKFKSNNAQFCPLSLFSSVLPTSACQNIINHTFNGISPVGIIRAPRGDGKESIVLVTPYNPENIKFSDALSLGLAYSIFALLSQVAWLAKDIIWLVADLRHGEYASVASWLMDYHNPCFGSNSCFENSEFITKNKTKYDDFRRAGTMTAALVVKVSDKARNERDNVDIYAEASNGQMPNLDLINVVNYLAVYRQGLQMKVGTFSFLRNSPLLCSLGGALQRLSRFVESINSKWKLGISSADFVDGMATLASSMYYQALGVPTGSHGAFRDFQVDAITMEFSSRVSLTNANGLPLFLLRGGRLVEGVVRSVNSLLEKFHQSFFLYFLTSPSKFVSVGIYMIPFALFVTPLPIKAAALFSSVLPTNWLYSAELVLFVHLWALVFTLLLHFIYQIPNTSSTTSMLSWVVLSFCSLLILVMGGFTHSCSDGHQWKVLKSVMIAVASIGISLMSIINFSTAQIGSIFLVPMCLLVRPLRRPVSTSLFLRLLIGTLNILLGVAAFPPASIALLKGAFQGFDSVGVGDFWEWTEFLWTWNSATYLYVMLIHLPCWQLCMHILLQP